jgi:hypothetical protein
MPAQIFERKGRVSNRQLKAIWGVAGRLGIGAPDLHLRIEALTGKRSLRQLTVKEAHLVLDDLLSLSGRSPVRISEESEVPFGGTPSQKQFLFALADQVHWSPGRLEGLARKMYGAGMAHCSVSQISGLIEALKAIRIRLAA